MADEKRGKMHASASQLALVLLLIGLKDSRHLFIQSEVKPKPIVTRSHAFSRAFRQPHVITSSFDWFNVLSVSYVIGQSNYLGFGFTTLKRKPLYERWIPPLNVIFKQLFSAYEESGVFRKVL